MKREKTLMQAEVLANFACKTDFHWNQWSKKHLLNADKVNVIHVYKFNL